MYRVLVFPGEIGQTIQMKVFFYAFKDFRNREQVCLQDVDGSIIHFPTTHRPGLIFADCLAI